MKAHSDAEIQSLLAHSTGLVQVSGSCQSLCLLQLQSNLPPLHADNQLWQATTSTCDVSDQQHCSLLVVHGAPSVKLAFMNDMNMRCK